MAEVCAGCGAPVPPFSCGVCGSQLGVVSDGYTELDAATTGHLGLGGNGSPHVPTVSGAGQGTVGDGGLPYQVPGSSSSGRRPREFGAAGYLDEEAARAYLYGDAVSHYDVNGDPMVFPRESVSGDEDTITVRQRQFEICDDEYASAVQALRSALYDAGNYEDQFGGVRPRTASLAENQHIAWLREQVARTYRVRQHVAGERQAALDEYQLDMSELPHHLGGDGL